MSSNTHHLPDRPKAKERKEKHVDEKGAELGLCRLWDPFLLILLKPLGNEGSSSRRHPPDGPGGQGWSVVPLFRGRKCCSFCIVALVIRGSGCRLVVETRS